MRITRALAAALVLVLATAGLAIAKASHAGWPKIDGQLRINKSDAATNWHGTSRSDELLGGHGNDTLDGGGAPDVLWGDYKPSGQGTGQRDRLTGGAGGDFLYASHGYNVIHGDAGNDKIHAHFGRGWIDCGSGRDKVWVSHRGKPGWHIRRCEIISFETE